MSEVKLLPCPFCGSHNIGIFYKVGKRTTRTDAGIIKAKVYYYAGCKDCHSKGGDSVAYVTLYEPDSAIDKAQAEAAAKWNQRKPMEKLEKTLDGLEDKAAAAYRASKVGQLERSMDYYDGLTDGYNGALCLVRGGEE